MQCVMSAGGDEDWACGAWAGWRARKGRARAGARCPDYCGPTDLSISISSNVSFRFVLLFQSFSIVFASFSFVSCRFVYLPFYRFVSCGFHDWDILDRDFDMWDQFAVCGQSAIRSYHACVILSKDRNVDEIAYVQSSHRWVLAMREHVRESRT